MNPPFRTSASLPTNPADALFPIAHIEQMVHRFYAIVRDDAELGPIFARRIQEWPVHLDRMVLFWRAVLRSERTFTPSPHGAPPTLHRAIGELERAHFDRWLTLFGEVVDDVYPAQAARVVKARAARMALALGGHLPPSDASGPRSTATTPSIEE